jgi:hypothetical protein
MIEVTGGTTASMYIWDIKNGVGGLFAAMRSHDEGNVTDLSVPECVGMRMRIPASMLHLMDGLAGMITKASRQSWSGAECAVFPKHAFCRMLEEELEVMVVSLSCKLQKV